MRCLIRGALLGAFFFLCSLLHSGVDIHEQCSYHIEYDQFGKPSKVCIEAYRVVIPMMDGILLFDQREEYICKQEYNVIHNSIEEQKNHSSLQVNLPKYKESISYKIPVFQLRSQTQRPEGFYVSAREVPSSSLSVFELMSNNQLWNYFAYNKYCYEHFGMSSCAKFEMMALSCDKFKEKLLNNSKLSEPALLELLYDYLAGCGDWQKKEKYKKLEETVKRVVDNRISRKKGEAERNLQQQINKQKKQAEQELQNRQRELYQKFIEQQHKAVQDLYLLGDVVSDEIEQAREEALQQAELEGYMQYDQPYELDGITRGYLSHQHIAYVEYLHCHGTALQQQYHKEICDIFTQAAHQNLNIENRLQHQYQSPVLEHATNFAQAAQQTNQKDWISVTGVLTGIGMLCVDLCKEVYSRPFEYARAIAEGTLESAYDFGHMMLRPDKALYGLGQMLFYTLETVALIEASTEFADYACPKLQQRRDQISTALSAIQHEFVNADGPARVKAITKVGADFYLPAKLAHAAGYLIGGISSRARGMRTLEGVSSLLDESLITAEAAEKIREIEVATEQGFTQKIAAEFMEADSTIAKAGNMTARPLKVLVDEIKKFKNGIIPFDRVDLKEEVRAALQLVKDRFKNQEYLNLQKRYGRKTILRDGKKYDINLLMDHTLTFDFHFEKIKKAGGFDIRISGGHSPGVWKLLEAEGLVSIQKIEKLENGCTKYLIKETFSNKTYTKTEFPLNWDHEKIVFKAWDVFEKGKDIPAEQGKQAKALVIDNVEMSIILKFHNEACNVITILPYIEKVNL